MDKKYSYTPNDIEQSLQVKSWWAIIFILPFVRRISYIILNYSDIKPNTITFLSFILILISSYCFYVGTAYYLIAGAIFFEISYIFDCIDGTVARVKKIQSNLGAYFDWMTDRLKIIILCISLAYGQFKINSDVSILLLFFLYLGLNNLVVITRSAQEKIINQLDNPQIKHGKDMLRNNEGFISRWINYTTKKNWMPYYHDIEIDAIIFVIAPIFNVIYTGLIIGNILAIMLILLLNILFIVKLVNLSGSK